MQDNVFTNINKIIERDSKSTTYKFALLRGVIDIIQENSPHITIYGNNVTIPTGLLIEKWMIYYYPILDCHLNIPQSNGERNLSFGNQFRKVISAYSKKERNGFKGFYEDLKKNGIPGDIYEDFLMLAKRIYDAITTMPFKHIGYSITRQHYSIFSFTPPSRMIRPYIIDKKYLVDCFGTFTIPLEYYRCFKMLGSFINGQDSILFKWAEFSVKASHHKLTAEQIISQVVKTPVSDRDIADSKRIYESMLTSEGKLRCVWTGDLIKNYEIDHLIPFSVWRNNDLWNLLPTKRAINSHKRDKIPTPDTIEKHKDQVLYYWEHLNKEEPQKFMKEISMSLVRDDSQTRWQDAAIGQLQISCEYLISERGFEAWTI